MQLSDLAEEAGRGESDNWLKPAALLELLKGEPVKAAVALAAEEFGPRLKAIGASAARSLLESLADASETPEIPYLNQSITKAVLGMPQGSPGGSPPERVAALSALERMTNDSVQATDSTLDDVIKGKGAGPLRTPPTPDVLDVAGKVRDVATNPQAMAALAQRYTGEIGEHAPNIANSATQAIGRMYSYLGANAPAATRPFPFAPELAPDRTDLLVWHDKLQAVRDPLKTLQAMPHPHVVAAVAAVYPALMQQVRSGLVTKIAEKGLDKLSFADRDRASVILGQDLTGNMDPASIRASQEVYQQAPRARGPAPRAEGVKGRRQHDLSRKLSTYAERLTPQGQEQLRNPW